MNPDYMPRYDIEELLKYYKPKDYLRLYEEELWNEKECFEEKNLPKLSAQGAREYFSRFIKDKEDLTDLQLWPETGSPERTKPDIGHLVSWVAGQSHEPVVTMTGLIIDKRGTEVQVLCHDGEAVWLRRSFVTVIS